MKLTTSIRPEDIISLDPIMATPGEFVVTDVRPNQFGGDNVTYVNDGEEWTVDAGWCKLVREAK